MILRRLLPSLALFLSGCAETLTGYPSLAKRAVENAPVAEPVAAPAPVEADPALQAQVDRLSAQAQSGSAAFDRAWPAADRATRSAAGAAVSSEAWVAAQLAISALEAARNDSVSALASLDTLYVERSNAVAEGKVRGGVEQIDVARKAALGIVDSQNDRIDAVKARLAQP
ncbi:hypothetical protein [Novosphingobium sp. Chol11]|jgi:hypothetical protein|uniref:hypothetical protein n=1 Tax=Novosphingobium sp. Chol11 TaxID=1385763 RepID=UPI000BE38DC0|nr:hypothetical protein [Novosphingobium sp. Chol11]